MQQFTVSQSAADSEINQAAFFLIDFFTHMAGGRRGDINVQDWRGLSNIVADTQSGALTLLVAKDESTSAAVGVCGVALNGEILHTFVHEDHRGLGVGRLLGEAAMEHGGWFFSAVKENASMLRAVEGARLLSEQSLTYVYDIRPLVSRGR